MKKTYIPPFVCCSWFDAEVLADIVSVSVTYTKDGDDGQYFEDFFAN